MKGLRQVIVATGLEAAHTVGRIAARGQEEHRRVVAALAQQAADRETVELGLWQHDIQQHEAAGFLLQPVESAADHRRRESTA